MWWNTWDSHKTTRLALALAKIGQNNQAMCLHLRVIRMVNLWKRYGKKLRIIMLLQFGLVTFRFGYGRTRQPRFSWFLDFWHPWDPLFMDLNIPDHFRIANTKKTRFRENIFEYEIWNSEHFKESCNLEHFEISSLGNGNFETLELWNFLAT